MRIIVTTEIVAQLAARMKEIIETDGACKCSVAIGEIDGIHYRLEAYSPEEKEDEGHDDPLPENVCLSSEGGAQ